MQRLVLSVEDAVAQKWLAATSARKEEIVKWFSWLLVRKEAAEMSATEFARLLDSLSDKAVANGLTPEILEEILHEN